MATVSLNINLIDTENFQVKVAASAKIKDIKYKVQSEKTIPLKNQQLKFNSIYLHEQKTLSEYKIQENSTLSLNIVFPTQVQSFDDVKVTEVSADACSHVRDLKTKIQQEKGIPINEQHLYFNGSELSNEMVLPPDRYEQANVIKLDLYLRDSMIISVKAAGSKAFPVSVRPSDPIDKTKARIQSMVGNETNLSLQFLGENLNDACTIDEANIPSLATIEMFSDRHPRNGAEKQTEKPRQRLSISKKIRQSQTVINKLSPELINCSNKVNELADNYNEITDSINKKSKREFQLVNDKTRLQREIVEKNQEVETKELQKEIRAAAGNLVEEIDAELSNLHQQLNAKIKEVQQCNDEIEKLRREKEELSKEAERYQKERDIYKSKAEHFEQLLQSEQEEMNREIEKLKLISNRQQMEAPEYKELLEIYNTCNWDVSEWKLRLKALRQKLDEIQEEDETKHDLIEKITQVETQLNSAKQQLSAAVQKLTDKQQEVNELTQVNEELSTQLTESGETIDVQEHDIKELREKNEDLETKLNSVEQTLSVTQQELAEREEEMMNLKLGNEELTTELDECREHMTEQLKNLNKMEDMLKELEVERNQTLQRLEEAKTELQKKNEALEKLTCKHKELSTQITKSQQTIFLQEENIKDLTEKIGELETQLRSTKQHLSTAEQQLADEQQEVMGLTQVNEELSTQLTAHNNRMEVCRKRNEELQELMMRNLDQFIPEQRATNNQPHGNEGANEEVQRRRIIFESLLREHCYLACACLVAIAAIFVAFLWIL